MHVPAMETKRLQATRVCGAAHTLSPESVGLARRVPSGAQASSIRVRGASILIALLFFLVCATVGAVVLTAATVTTGQLVALEKSQQAYYSTTSAAELLRDAVVGGTGDRTGSGDGAVWTVELPVQETSSGSATNVGTSAENSPTLSCWLASSVREVQATGRSQKLDGITISMPSRSDSEQAAKAVVPVAAVLTMNADCSLSIALRPSEYTGAVGSYRVLCEIPASLRYEEDGATVERVVWERATIEKPLSAMESGGGQ